jgi:predicted RNase H-like HicB family nuclease
MNIENLDPTLFDLARRLKDSTNGLNQTSLARTGQRPRALVIIRPNEEHGYWAEVPGLPGCATEADTYEELLANLRDVIQGYLLTTPGNFTMEEPGSVVEIEL